MSIIEPDVQQANAPFERRSPQRVEAGPKLRHDQRLKRVQKVARWMDASFTLPGTSIRFGWDSVLGLIPGVGDALTAVTGGWILREAHQSGAPKGVMARMVGNVAVDMVVGVIPLVGDLFDVYWKANVRNARLLEEHLRNNSRAEPR